MLGYGGLGKGLPGGEVGLEKGGRGEEEELLDEMRGKLVAAEGGKIVGDAGLE